MRLVLAGSFREYENWLKETGLDPTDYRYISEPQDLYGCHNLEVIRVGRSWRNPLEGSFILKAYERRLK